jgi:lipopolysaccharide biosynthesis regulator YciM
MRETMATRYSLLDPDLPLLAVDAACELDTHIASGYQQQLQLKNTVELLKRLQQITSEEHPADVDKQLVVHALSHERATELLDKPVSVKISLERLSTLIAQHQPEQTDEKLFLARLRDVFLGISEFAMETRRSLVSNDSGHPYATL